MQGSIGMHRAVAALAAFGLLALAPLAPSLAQPTSSSAMLANVKARGSVRCGVNPGLAGFSFPNRDGSWQGCFRVVSWSLLSGRLGSETLGRCAAATRPSRPFRAASKRREAGAALASGLRREVL